MLLLKNAVKDIFNKAGLGDFTVGRDGNGYLNIVGPCGKSLVPVTNFAIGSKLTKTERDICIDDHLIPVLTAHSKSILDLIAAKADQNKAEEDVKIFWAALKSDDYHIVRGNDGYNSTELSKRYVDITSRVKGEPLSVSLKVYAAGEVKPLIEAITDDAADIKKVPAILKVIQKDMDDAIALIQTEHEKQKETNRLTAKLTVECEL